MSIYFTLKTLHSDGSTHKLRFNNPTPMGAYLIKQFRVFGKIKAAYLHCTCHNIEEKLSLPKDEKEVVDYCDAKEFPSYRPYQCKCGIRWSAIPLTHTLEFNCLIENNKEESV